jgi:hypothetical protein
MGSIVKGIFNIGGSIISSGKKKKASAKAQAAMEDAINKSIDITKTNTAQETANLQPFRDAGAIGLNRLTQGFNDGTFTKTFTPGDLASDPGYQFRLAEGERRLDRQANARGALFSGNQLRAADEYGQGFASNEYNDARRRFDEDRDQNYNKTMSLADLGYNSTNATNNVINNETTNLRDSFGDFGSTQAHGIAERGAISANMWQGIFNDLGSMGSDVLSAASPGTSLATLFKKGK